jgi:hypothetical protein
MTTIKSNQVPRDTLDWHDLSPKEQAEFDWLDQEATGFFRYRGDVYHLGQFERIPEGGTWFSGWDGSQATSMTTGLLVRLVGEQVVVGTWQS